MMMVIYDTLASPICCTLVIGKIGSMLSPLSSTILFDMLILCVFFFFLFRINHHMLSAALVVIVVVIMVNSELLSPPPPPAKACCYLKLPKYSAESQPQRQNDPHVQLGYFC